MSRYSIYKGSKNSPEIVHQVASRLDVQTESSEVRYKVVTHCKRGTNKVEGMYYGGCKMEGKLQRLIRVRKL